MAPREYSLRLGKNFKYPFNLLEQVYKQQVVLEQVFLRELNIYGSIRVNNCSFEKHVSIRYTIDQWKHTSILQAYYSTHYPDNNTDLFHFKLTVPKEKIPDSAMNISFAICYTTNDDKFWDNNFSQNYTVEIVESTSKETNSIVNQFSSNEMLQQQQLARDYYAISNPSDQAGNLCGLKNLGGTCYMNSTIQALSYTSLLTNYLMSNQFSKDMQLNNGNIVIKEYFNLLYLLCCGKYSALTPRPFKQTIGHIKYVYLRNEQQDAHEFLLFLLDYFHRELTRIKSNEIVSDTSIITDLFYGTYRSTTTCTQCSGFSHNFEPFMCLSLSIPLLNQCTLEDCLAHLHEDEYLDDDSKWFCPTCRCLRNAKKRLEISKFPKILIIQLKRFQLDFDNNWIKNNTLVFYPEDNLHLPPQTVYTLYSVINHYGSLNDGHYTAFSRDISSPNSAWFEYDDDNIKYLSADKLHWNSNAYLLFYTIKSTSE